MFTWPWQKKPPEPVKPPKVGGTRAPDLVIEIDFKRPHDYHFRLASGGYNGGGGVEVFRACVLLGFTTPTGDGALGGSFGEWQHDRWLVLRRPDGRVVYVPRDGLCYIEESRPDDLADGRS